MESFHGEPNILEKNEEKELMFSKFTTVTRTRRVSYLRKDRHAWGMPIDGENGKSLLVST